MITPNINSVNGKNFSLELYNITVRGLLFPWRKIFNPYGKLLMHSALAHDICNKHNVNKFPFETIRLEQSKLLLICDKIEFEGI